jgi:hypothetical protein
MPDVTRNRHVIGLALSIVTVPVLAFSFVNPGVGGVAFVAGGAMILVTWLVSREPVPAVEIVGWGAALAFGFVTVVGAVIVAFSPDSGTGDQLPWWLWVPLIGYLSASAVTVAGGVWHVVRHVKTLRREPSDS